MTVCEWRWWVRWDMIPEMARRELCKPDASTVSICSLYTVEKRFSGNRESCPFWFRSREFTAKREFSSLFRAVRIGFEGYGRTFFHFLRFFLLSKARNVTVDKNWWNSGNFVYDSSLALFPWKIQYRQPHSDPAILLTQQNSAVILSITGKSQKSTFCP